MYKADAIRAHNNFLEKVKSFPEEYQRTQFLVKHEYLILSYGEPIYEADPDEEGQQIVTVSVYHYGQIKRNTVKWDVYELPNEYIFIYNWDTNQLDIQATGQVPIQIGKLIKDNEKAPSPRSLATSLLTEA